MTYASTLWVGIQMEKTRRFRKKSQPLTDHSPSGVDFIKVGRTAQIIEIARLKLGARRKAHSTPLKSFSKVGRRVQKRRKTVMKSTPALTLDHSNTKPVCNLDPHWPKCYISTCIFLFNIKTIYKMKNTILSFEIV